MFRAFVQSIASETDEQRSERQLAAILAADNADEVLNANVITKAEDILGHRLTVEGVRAAESDYADGPDFYLIFDCFDNSTGKPVTVECGAAEVVVKVARLAQLGLLPVDLVIRRKDKATRNGFFPLFAELAPPAFD
jgi:hypothetical protein